MVRWWPFITTLIVANIIEVAVRFSANQRAIIRMFRCVLLLLSLIRLLFVLLLLLLQMHKTVDATIRCVHYIGVNMFSIVAVIGMVFACEARIQMKFSIFVQLFVIGC